MAQKRGKKYRKALESVDVQKIHEPTEALNLVKQVAFATFDETVEVAFRLGLDPKRVEQQLRGSVVLPHGIGRKQSVVVIAKGDQAIAAKEAGADFVGDDDIIERIKQNWLDFDVMVATPDMMPKVGQLGRILGPRGLMPNPKTGTVTADVAKAVEEIKAGKIEYRVDRTGNIHVGMGKVSFSVEQLLDNLRTLAEELVKVKPSTCKGIYMRSVTVTSTMGPGVPVDPQTLYASTG